MLQYISDLCDLAVLGLDRREEFFYARCQQLLNFLLEQGPDSVEEFFSLGLLHLSLTDLIALHELEQVGELEVLLALMLEYFAPLVKYIKEDLLSMELITVE